MESQILGRTALDGKSQFAMPMDRSRAWQRAPDHGECTAERTR
jgi:hypothetical protein